MSLFGKGPDSKPGDNPPPAAPPAPKVAPPPPTVVMQAPVIPGRAPAPAAPVASGAACVVGAKTTLKGELTGDEDVLIEGRVEGQIRISRDLRIGPTGVVKATID